MIQTLIDTLLARLAVPLVGVNLSGGPLAVEPPQALPALVLAPGPFVITPSGSGEASDEPRSQPARQLIKVSKNQDGPYTLERTPLRASLRVRAITKLGKLAERQTLLVEGQDFTVDYEKEKLTLAKPASETLQLAVDYSFVGVYGVHEFRQTLLVDAYGADMGVAEHWASLAMSVLLTTTKEILEASTLAAQTGYRASPFSATHRFHKLQFVEGVPGASGSAYKVQLKFIVNGQTQVMKELTDSFGIIESIQSPGKTKVVGVDVEVRVGV